MHRYRVTVESLADGSEVAPIQFEAENHDDLHAIVRRASTRFGLDEDSTKAMIIGLKLLGEVVLKNRDKSPFVELRPALRDFTLQLKQASSPEPEAN